MRGGTGHILVIRHTCVRGGRSRAAHHREMDSLLRGAGIRRAHTSVRDRAVRVVFPACDSCVCVVRVSMHYRHAQCVLWVSNAGHVSVVDDYAFAATLSVSMRVLPASSSRVLTISLCIYLVLDRSIMLAMVICMTRYAALHIHK